MKPLVLPERFRLLLVLTACILAFAQAAHADGPSITTGLGYKPMVQQLCAAYTRQSGVKPTEMYSGSFPTCLLTNAHTCASSISRSFSLLKNSTFS